MKDYVYIRAWGMWMHSYQYYIDGQVDLARAHKAPSNAIYHRGDGDWATFDDVTNPDTRRWVALIVEEMLNYQENSGVKED